MEEDRNGTGRGKKNLKKTYHTKVIKSIEREQDKDRKKTREGQKEQSKKKGKGPKEDREKRGR